MSRICGQPLLEGSALFSGDLLVAQDDEPSDGRVVGRMSIIDGHTAALTIENFSPGTTAAMLRNIERAMNLQTRSRLSYSIRRFQDENPLLG